MCAENPFNVHFFLEGLDSSIDGSSSFGSFVLQVRPDWAKLGAARVRELVQQRFFDGCGFFRVVPGFMAQFGLSGKPDVGKDWIDRRIPDDERQSEVSNTRGRVSFAKAGAGTRTTQLFISISNNSYLDSMGFVPIGEVVSGMNDVDRIYKVGEGPPKGPGPNPGKIQQEGNVYLKRAYPNLTYVKSTLLTPARKSHSRELRASTGTNKSGGGETSPSGVAAPPGDAGSRRASDEGRSGAGLKQLQAEPASHSPYTIMLSVMAAGAFIFVVVRRCMMTFRKCALPWDCSLEGSKNC